jgi:hypothetical protein
MRIEISDPGNAHTGFERPPSFRALRLPAVVRLFPGSSIKALDPVGTGLPTCLLLLIDKKLRKKVANSWQFLSARQLYYRFAPVEQL